jgi:hypothetical protein
MSPPAKMPGWPCHHVRSDRYRAVLDRETRHAIEQRQVDLLAECQHQRVRLQRFELARRLRKSLVVERHLFHGQRAFVGHVADRRQPLDEHTLLQGFLDFEIVRRHFLARAAVHDDGFARTQPLRSARDVERRIAAAVDDDAAPQHGLLLALHAAQHRHCVEHVCRGAGRM